MVGLLAIDVIVGRRDMGGIPLPSGRFVRIIEANMRLNGHTMERLFAWRIALRDGIDADEIHHMRLGAHAVGAVDMHDARARFAQALRGVAKPFCREPLVRGALYYVVIDNHGGGVPVSIYDSVMLFGHQCDASAFEHAKRALSQAELLRI